MPLVYCILHDIRDSYISETNVRNLIKINIMLHFQINRSYCALKISKNCHLIWHCDSEFSSFSMYKIEKLLGLAHPTKIYKHNAKIVAETKRPLRLINVNYPELFQNITISKNDHVKFTFFYSMIYYVSNT